MSLLVGIVFLFLLQCGEYDHDVHFTALFCNTLPILHVLMSSQVLIQFLFASAKLLSEFDFEHVRKTVCTEYICEVRFHAS